MKKHSNISQTLVYLLKKKKISMRTLAKKSQIPLSTLASYASAKKSSYSSDHLIRLSEVLDVSLDYLLTGQERQPINLDSLPLEKVFSGYFKIKLEKINIPNHEE